VKVLDHFVYQRGLAATDSKHLQQLPHGTEQYYNSFIVVRSLSWEQQQYLVHFQHAVILEAMTAVNGTINIATLTGQRGARRLFANIYQCCVVMLMCDAQRYS
jgi:hypothetical protein